jgi:hypothetical protein
VTTATFNSSTLTGSNESTATTTTATAFVSPVVTLSTPDIVEPIALATAPTSGNASSTTSASQPLAAQNTVSIAVSNPTAILPILAPKLASLLVPLARASSPLITSQRVLPILPLSTGNTLPHAHLTIPLMQRIDSKDKQGNLKLIRISGSTWTLPHAIVQRQLPLPLSVSGTDADRHRPRNTILRR